MIANGNRYLVLYCPTVLLYCTVVQFCCTVSCELKRNGSRIQILLPTVLLLQAHRQRSTIYSAHICFAGKLSMRTKLEKRSFQPAKFRLLLWLGEKGLTVCCDHQTHNNRNGDRSRPRLGDAQLGTKAAPFGTCGGGGGCFVALPYRTKLYNRNTGPGRTNKTLDFGWQTKPQTMDMLTHTWTLCGFFFCCSTVSSTTRRYYE
jgi:hypothetical protein